MDVLGHLISQRASQCPDHPVVTVADQTLTYKELDQRSDAFATGLGTAGMGLGDHAAIMLPNGAAFFDAWIGMAKAGVVEVPLHTASRAAGLLHALRLTQARLLVVHKTLLPRIREVIDDLPALRMVVVVDAADKVSDAHLGTAELVTLTDFEDSGRALTQPVVSPTDHSAVLFTSGTTGPSKGVVLSHRANFRLARTVSQAGGFTQGEVLFTTFPLFHVAARYVSTLAAMLVGGRVVIQEHFSASRFWAQCEEHGVTAIHYLGSLLTMLLKQSLRETDRTHRVRVAYGAGGPEPVAKEFTARFGVPLLELYGMTETGAVSMNSAGQTRLGSCGRVLEDCEVEIHDDADRPVPIGEVGEIVVRPREPHTMIEEYIGMPEATLDAFRNLWFHTGDSGQFDADGYLYFSGRRKDAIRRRGENISAAEVETALHSHPSVEGAAVVGVPDSVSGEEVMAFLQPRPGVDLDFVAVLDHCQALLPYFAVPRYLTVVDELPRNSSQRVQKHLLVEQGVPGEAFDRHSIDYHISR